MVVYLKYKDTTGTWSASETFNALRWEPLKSSDKIQGEGLRGIRFTDINFIRSNSKKMTISADELYDPTKRAFMDDFFIKGVEWKYSEDNWSTEVIVDLAESGTIPYEWIEGNILMPRITLSLIQKYPD